jgi:hypothetical protein
MNMKVQPAYGRDYKSAKAVKADFAANKDFVINDLFGGNDGRYVNKQDLNAGDTVTVRFNNQRNVCVVKVTK